MTNRTHEGERVTSRGRGESFVAEEFQMQAEEPGKKGRGFETQGKWLYEMVDPPSP